MVKYFFSAGDGKLTRSETFLNKCWVDMVDPTDDECEDVAAISGVPEDMIKAALDEQERARSEFDEGCSMFVVDCPIPEEGEGGDSYTTLPLSIIYNSRCVITVSLKGNTVLKDFITGREKVFCDRPVHFALTFMLNNAKRFLYCLKQIDRKNHRIQNEVGRTMKNTEIIQLLDLQNSLVYFSTSLSANERVHAKLSKAEAVTTSEDYQDLYEDLSIENKQAIETCNIYKNILSVTMDAYGSVISNNSNDSMRRLTIITILLAVPTMIAGFWGMNMPVPGENGVSFLETGWFWLVIAATAVLTAAIAVFIVRGNPLKRAQRQKRRRRRDKKDKNK
ncbi:MAG: magnesium transporter CorA family protein [Clostridia bacterium]|jgi:magnesium transporter|nr:magnesium transporter CorA family protein [Clostridia bacterium]